jgi:hypothetical protein
MLGIGDRVEIMARTDAGNRGRFGDIVHIDTGIKPVVQPTIRSAPGRYVEPRYSVKLNSGEVVHHLMEQQLRKL